MEETIAKTDGVARSKPNRMNGFLTPKADRNKQKNYYMYTEPKKLKIIQHYNPLYKKSNPPYFSFIIFSISFLFLEHKSTNPSPRLKLISPRRLHPKDV
jgi:hypothetical protein